MGPSVATPSPPPLSARLSVTSGRTCMPTLSCPEAPPCTPVSLTGCRRRSPPWLPPPSRSGSLLLLRGSTQTGSEDPSWPPSPPSSRCGSPSRSTTSAAHPLSTASASKCFLLFLYVCIHLDYIPFNFKFKFEIDNLIHFFH